MSRFKRARELAGLSINQAAKLLGWLPARIEDIENFDQWSESEINDLAHLYHCGVRYLSGDPLPAPRADLMLQLEDKGVSPSDCDAVIEFAQMLDMLPPQHTERLITLSHDEPKNLADQLSRETKARYVKSQGQTRKHRCHWPGCIRQVPPAMWGCKQHWSRLPLHLRNKIWAAYRPGQERDMAPSQDYLTVADEVQNWIKGRLVQGTAPLQEHPGKTR